MKLSALLLTTISAAMLTACEKSSNDVQPAADDTVQQSADSTNVEGPCPPAPYNCPACGMG